MSNTVPIMVAYGDGIGPEIMAASLHILKEAGLGRVLDQDVEIVKTETLRNFDGKPGYSLAQGQ